MYGLFRSVRFLFLGPILLAMLFVINLVTAPGHWWVQWAALGIGIAWIIALVRVVGTIVLAGGIAALVAFLRSRART